jgi:type I restriction enzyme S subunit
MSWEIRKFGDVVEFPPKVKLEKKEQYSFIPMDEVEAGRKYVGPKYLKEWKGSGGARFEEGDTLFARITPCLQNGKIAQAKGLINGKGFGSTEFFIFRGIEGVTDTDFVYYLSVNSEFSEYAIGSMVGASGRQRADTKFVGEYEFNLPPLQTQKRIADILSGYDDLIENNLKRIKLLEQAAQNIYKEWFVNLRFPGHENADINEDTGLPEGWKSLKFGEVFNVQNGYAFKSGDYKDKGIPVLRTRDYSSSFFINISDPIFLSEDFSISHKKYFVKELDFLIIMVGASIGKNGLVLKKDLPALQNQNQWAIRVKKEFYAYEYFKIYCVKSIIETLLMKRTGAARDFFRASFIKEIDIQIPDEHLVKKFTKQAQPCIEQINFLLAQNDKLKAARDILLPRLMNRTIEV